MAPHHPKNRPIHILRLPADRFINSPCPFWICLFCPEKEAKSTIDREPRSGRPFKLVRGRCMNRSLFWDDGVGRLLKELFTSSHPSRGFGSSLVWYVFNPSSDVAALLPPVKSVLLEVSRSYSAVHMVKVSSRLERASHLA